ncbi:hypothetical protein [Streptomyces tanashiensis]|uniref:hypothetical protein n=1 Tax=Streptomyces tanashiensis TaxID=67367 RepID=UPI00167CBA89|nr:hypothetical protein [Streptomyces tanashiensis]GGY40172.1 hypothetical protein GCM10010299_53250 [Streptomyces tanashiensis]
MTRTKRFLIGALLAAAALAVAAVVTSPAPADPHVTGAPPTKDVPATDLGTDNIHAT